MYFSDEWKTIEKQIMWSNGNHLTMGLLSIFYSKLLSKYLSGKR